MEKYKKIRRLGQGAHGVVYLYEVLPQFHKQVFQHTGTHRDHERKREYVIPDPPYVAIKKIHVRDSTYGLSMEAIREIKLLQELSHPNIISVYDIFCYESNVHLSLEFGVGDLENIIKNPNILLAPADIKAYLKMMLAALKHCHANWVMHRDIKPSNFLISFDGTLKLADFGLAKLYGSPDRNQTSQACTLWYRAPELLFGANRYGAAADIWSLGCVFGELWWRKPMMASPNMRELEQLQTIFAVLGTPTEQHWPHMKYLSNYSAFSPMPRRSFEELFSAAPNDALDLMSRMLTFNPQTRITAAEALAHPYFSNEPAPTPVAKLPKLPASSVAETMQHAATALVNPGDNKALIEIE